MATLASGWPHTGKVSRPHKARRQTWDSERKQRMTDMWLDRSTPVAEIADMLETSPGAIYIQARKLGLPPRTGRRGPNRLPKRDTTGQRRFTGVEPGKGQRIELKAYHPALRHGSTIYGQLLEPAIEAKNLLRSGEWNRKIGAQAEKGRWKGMPIFTLTLEERATCPRTCLEWRTCYGNNMGRAPRLFDDGWLLPRLRVELAHHGAMHPRGFIVRLHVLGDFYSVDYVRFWQEMLEQVPQLHIFGFTAWQPSTDIGHAVLELMAADLDRVAMRVSGAGHALHCSEVVTSREEATGVVCPAELDKERCCATCGLCWQSERTITFLRH